MLHGELFPDDDARVKAKKEASSIETLQKMGCKACPYNTLRSLKHPKMDATGKKRPLIYMLGEAPGADEDKVGKQFIGESGQLLRDYIPEEYEDCLRWNNSINCHPPKNATPALRELECCRPRVVADIEKSKPVAIFGFGGTALKWAVGEDGITKWRGRMLPIKVGNHKCWFFPMMHPAYLLRQRRKGRNGRTMPSENEYVFRRDLERAFKQVKKLKEPVIPDETEVRAGVSYVDGSKGWDDVRRIREELEAFGELERCGYDYETASDESSEKRQVRPYGKGARILTAAVGTRKRAFAFPIWHREAKWTEPQRKKVIVAWKKFLRSKAEKIAHNLFFELEWQIFMYGKRYARSSKWGDTMAQAYVLDARKGMLSLDTMVLINFGFNLKVLSPLNKKRLDQEPLHKVLDYNALDAKWTAALDVKQRTELAKRKQMKLYREQVRRTPTIALKSYFGVLIDFDAVIDFDKKYTKTIEKLRDWIDKSKTAKKYRQKFGKQFNPSSHQDVLRIFKDVLNRKECLVDDPDNPGKKKWSTDDTVLEKIDHPMAKKIRELRAVVGNKAKYVDPILPKGYKPKITNKPSEVGKCIWDDGLTHATIQTLFLVTRRTSCAFPNEQFWPKRDERYKDLRKTFIAPTREALKRLQHYGYPLPSHMNPEDCWKVTIDQGQVEARVAGMHSRDRKYCLYIWDRNDLHMEWTQNLARAYPARIGGKKFLKDPVVLKTFRTDVKNQWTFPLIYGATDNSVAGYLHMPVEIISELREQFFAEMPGLKDWQDGVIEHYRKFGYVESFSGWRRYEPVTKNEIINTPIQGDASDITMDAFNRLSESAQELDMWQFQARLEVHDELGFWIPKKTFDRDIEFIAPEMLRCDHLPWINVPLCIEISSGTNWYDVKETKALFSDDFGLLDRKACGF